MKRIKHILNEIESSLRNIDIFLVIMKSLVLLTVSYLVLFMLGIEPYLALIPAVVYFISSLFVESRVDNVRSVERKYSELDEKLRTARDYQDKDNIVLDALENDIVANLKDVRVSAFYPFSRISILIFLLVLTVGLSMYVASRDIRLIDFDDIWKDAVKMFEIEEEEEKDAVDFTSTEESIMEVGNEKIQVEINPVGIAFDFNDVSEQTEYEFSAAFPKEIFISSGAAYENEFTEEQQALIKRYFEKKRS